MTEIEMAIKLATTRNKANDDLRCLLYPITEEMESRFDHNITIEKIDIEDSNIFFSGYYHCDNSVWDEHISLTEAQNIINKLKEIE